ncbi:MAG: hypothetical protein LBB53_03695 [Prevotellaceae bacterium]|jgi:hypothetical protein|nr:hypothetical protein [Prevotellaceae bacterium]
MPNKTPYIEKMLEISRLYLEETFSNKELLLEFLQKIDFLKNKTNRKEIISEFDLL